MPRRRNMSLFLLIVVHDATLYQERRKTHIARNIFLFRGVQAEQLPAFCKLLSDFRNVRRVAEACYLGFRPLGLIDVAPVGLSRVGEPFCLRAVLV